MSREIPMDQPLSDEDREYLTMRGQHGKIELIDAQYPAPDADAEEADAEAGGSEEVPPYEKWLLKDLSAEAERRGLAKSGTIADLSARLYQWDEEHPEE